MSDLTKKCLNNSPLDCGSRFILERLESSGFKAYLVGGAVRDCKLGREIHDRDIATSAQPEEVEKVFSDCLVIPTGVKYKTVTVVACGAHYEVTTFRRDGDYEGNRRPVSVSDAETLIEDLARRDFTVNAIAYGLNEGYIDPFGGIADVSKRIIRAVGDPNERFTEDALRILRAMRFSSQLGFTVDEDTFRAACNNAQLLNNISKERIFDEFTKILQGQNAASVLREFHRVVFALFKELEPTYKYDQKNRSHCYDVYEHTLKALEICNSTDSEILWSLLIHDAGKPHTRVWGRDGYQHFPNHWVKSEEIAVKILTELKAPKHFTFIVSKLCRYHDDYFNTKFSVKKLLNEMGEEFCKKLMVVKRADLYAHSEYGINKFTVSFELTETLLNEILEKGECYKLSDLQIKGGDLMELGLSGKAVSQALESLLELVMQDKLSNDRDALIKYAKQNLL